ncbi:MAG: ComEC/Rec2 family competence protein [Bacteroidales bacterium]|nr:ComEC/Rec2 family competence protein [Bacteroidales bacterium]
MRRTPLVPVALALMAGIALQHWLTGMATWCWWAIMLTAALTAGMMLIFKRKISIMPTLMLILLFMMGASGSLGRRHDPLYNEHHWTHLSDNEHVYISVKLCETPQPRPRSWQSKAAVETIDGQPSEGTIRLYLRKDSTAATLHYGDRLLIHGFPDRARGTIYTTSDHYIITKRDNKSLRARSEALRMKLQGRLQAGPLEHRQAGVVEALTLGWRADIEPETQAAYRDAGVAHLLAVSGLHVGLLALLVGGLLFWINKEQKGRIVKGSAQLAAVWLFALLTGMAPSTVRAALMFSLFIVSNILARRTPKLNLWAATAIITLTANPMLLFDIGWQLSYSAVAGILLAQPIIRLYHNWIWQAATVSIAATLATLPVTIAAFHRMQAYFLIANVLIVPLAGAILTMSLIYIALPCAMTAWPLGWTLRGAEWMTERVSALPGAVVEVGETATWCVPVIAVAVLALLLAASRLRTNSPN